MKKATRRAEDYPLRRRESVAAILADHRDVLLVAGLGPASWDCTAAGDRDLTFPLWGAMGGAAAMGLGLALAQPQRKVLVITGDGEMMMGIGSLATVATQQPANLTIVVLDNERFEETGGQLTPTAGFADIAKIAEGCGIERTSTVRTAGELKLMISGLYKKPGPALRVIKINTENPPMVLAPKDGNELRIRFRKALLGTA
jgi:thiamine pyrophosphate-dependent acetolactate synthase large subunit-like protein